MFLPGDGSVRLAPFLHLLHQVRPCLWLQLSCSFKAAFQLLVVCVRIKCRHCCFGRQLRLLSLLLLQLLDLQLLDAAEVLLAYMLD